MGGTICRSNRSSDQESRSLLSLPWFFVNQFLRAAEIAEDTLGHPPTIMEIFVTFEKTFNTPISSIYVVSAVMTSLLREDLVFVDKICYRWTVRKQEGFSSYSERFRQLFGADGKYKCAPGGSIYPAKARTLSYSHLISVLKSKDVALLEENRWIWDGEFRFLDGQERLGFEGHRNHVQFTSFPRSGNSFLRRLVEQLTGTTTGSTMPLMTSTSL